MKRKVFAWVLAVLVPVFAIGPALTTPVEEHAIDTAAFHIYRAVMFSDAQAHGAGILPRWTPGINGGLGGPLFAYAPPLMYFIMDAWHGLGVDIALTWRALTVLMLLVASTGMFGLALELTRRADAALVAAAFFVYAPQLVRDFFERGSPQAVAVALFPWMVWLLLRLVNHPSGLRFAAVAVCWALLVVAHNVSALLLVPAMGLALVFLLVRERRVAPLAWPVLALAAGSFLSSFYAIPVLTEIKYFQMDNPAHVDYAYPPDNPTRLAELFTLPPVFDTGVENDSMGASLGILHLLTLPVGVLLAGYYWRRRQLPEAVLLAGLVALGVGVIWMQTASASFVWRALPLDVLQYRFRLVSLLGLVAGLIAAYALSLDWVGRWRGALVAGVIAVVIGMQLPSLYADLTHRQNDFSSHLTVADVQVSTIPVNTASLSSFNEYMPIWRHMPFSLEELQRADASPIANLPDGATILADYRVPNEWSVRLDTPVSFTAAFYLLYYPGWVARVDGVRQSAHAMDEVAGYLALDIPAGAHTVSLIYEGTSAQHWGDRISLGVAVLLLGLALLWKPAQQASESPPVYLQPHWALVAGILLVAGLKTAWIDPHTTLLRRTSTCDSIHGVDHYPDVNFDGTFYLCGYDLPKTTFEPGDRLTLTVYWEIHDHQQQSVSTFAHLVGQTFNPQTGNPVWGQEDQQTPAGHVMDLWVPGMLYRDIYAFTIPKHTPPGTYTLEIGWYDAAGTRFEPVLGADTGDLAVSDLDSLLLAEITVR